MSDKATRRILPAAKEAHDATPRTAMMNAHVHSSQTWLQTKPARAVSVSRKSGTLSVSLARARSLGLKHAPMRRSHPSCAPLLSRTEVGIHSFTLSHKGSGFVFRPCSSIPCSSKRAAATLQHTIVFRVSLIALFSSCRAMTSESISQ